MSALIDRMLARLLAAARPAVRVDAPVLDLHGYGVKDAIAATERFVAESAADGVREVRIVYGKGRRSPHGRGVLCEVIPRWLAGPGRQWVASAAPEPDASGADGAIRVRLVPPPAASDHVRGDD